MKEANLLYIEDDIDLGNETREFLENFNFKVSKFTNGRDAISHYKNFKNLYTTVIIDINLPDIDGYHVAKELKEINPMVDFMFLTARNMKSDRLKGLKLGAYDFISKPFDTDELLLKIQNLTSRKHNIFSFLPLKNEEITIGDIVINKDEYTLLIKACYSEKITQRELDVLNFFILHENQIVKREDILNAIWGENDFFSGRSLDVFISRLRKKMQHSELVKIQNIYGLGFLLSIEHSQEE